MIELFIDFIVSFFIVIIPIMFITLDMKHIFTTIKNKIFVTI